MKYSTILGFATALGLALFLAPSAASAKSWFDSGNGAGEGDERMTAALNKLLTEADRQTGLPALVHFTERKMVKYLYELRDQPNFATITYIVNLNGDLIKLCDSVGYGINASIQMTSPIKVIDEGDGHGNGYAYLPQAEPNGLFMPSGLSATYVICVDPDPAKDAVAAVYVEPEVIVSPFPLVLK